MNFSAKIRMLRNPQGKMKAFATVIVDGVLSLDGFKIFESSNGPFVAAPSERSQTTDENGKYKYFDKIRFLEDKPEGQWNGPVEKQMKDVVLAAYREAAGGGGQSQNHNQGQSRPQSGGERPAPAQQRPHRW